MFFCWGLMDAVAATLLVLSMAMGSFWHGRGRWIENLSAGGGDRRP